MNADEKNDELKRRFDEWARRDNPVFPNPAESWPPHTCPPADAPNLCDGCRASIARGNIVVCGCTRGVPQIT